MYYFRIAVRGSSGRQSVFIYEHPEKLAIGSVVTVPIHRKSSVGVILGQVEKPSFRTKSIETLIPAKVPLPLLKTMEWLSEYYASSLGTALQLALPVSLEKQGTPRKPSPPKLVRSSSKHETLTDDQSHAIRQIRESHSSVILHGQTGTGKTRVYAEVIQTSENHVLVLAPEIGMIPQLASDIATITTQVPVEYHSQLTPSQRRRIWNEISQSTKKLIVIGTRSALFLPFSKLSHIIIDEFHDDSYKHDAAPRYHANRLAARLAQAHGCHVVFGSATPPVSEYHTALEKNIPIVELHQAASTDQRNVSHAIVDRRDRSLFPRSKLFSTSAFDAIANALSNEQQVLFFLNRRGTAKMCLCNNCGWTALCSQCHLPLAYHMNNQLLMCHACGNREPIKLSCPDCGSADLRYLAPGVQAVEQELLHFFPAVSALRIDSDTTSDPDRHSQLQALVDGDISFLIGTQSIAKGLDLSKLHTAIIVDADSGAQLPDYLAGERTFQLLYQVMGRVGRHGPGHVVIQTLHPENPILTYALARDYQSFYTQELQARRALHYPPFQHLGRIVIQHKNEQTAERLAMQLAKNIHAFDRSLRLRGPAKCFYSKLHNRYRWHLIASSPVRSQILRVAELLPKQAYLDLDPTQLL